MITTRRLPSRRSWLRRASCHRFVTVSRRTVDGRCGVAFGSRGSAVSPPHDVRWRFCACATMAFAVLASGSPSYDAVDTGRAHNISIAWFWCFAFLQFLVMFNMIISILFDVYASVSEEVNAGEIIPMAQQLRCLLRNSAIMRRFC